MTDFESRLRAALRGAAEPAPPGLLAAVMRRHRRHQVRAGAGVLAVAAAAAFAIPPVTAALHGAAGHRTGRAARGATSPAPTRPRWPAASAGTVVSGCENGPPRGAIGRRWRTMATHEAGPLWLLNGGHSSGRIRLYVGLVVLDNLRPGTAVVLKAAPANARHLRFLYGPGDSLNPGTRYTMRSGEAGVTFVACRTWHQSASSPGLTDYYGGFLVLGPRCVPVRAWLPGRRDPVTVRLGACAGH
jgi:hypothetical protein